MTKDQKQKLVNSYYEMEREVTNITLTALRLHYTVRLEGVNYARAACEKLDEYRCALIQSQYEHLCNTVSQEAADAFQARQYWPHIDIENFWQ